MRNERNKILDKWSELKKRVSKKNQKIVHNGDIWWCSVCHNAGDEENGKNELFDRNNHSRKGNMYFEKGL